MNPNLYLIIALMTALGINVAAQRCQNPPPLAETVVMGTIAGIVWPLMLPGYATGAIRTGCPSTPDNTKASGQ